jgi:DnaJ family protein C protein 9
MTGLHVLVHMYSVERWERVTYVKTRLSRHFTTSITVTMDEDDPISQFFPDQESVDLYAVLSLTETATVDEIKKAYRRLALIHHPDKHASSSTSAKAEAATKFQQVGFAYAVLSDEKRRQRYDRTGKTDEGFELAGEDGWEAYFEELFDRATRGKLDEMKKDYQGKSFVDASAIS